MDRAEACMIERRGRGRIFQDHLKQGGNAISSSYIYLPHIINCIVFMHSCTSPHLTSPHLISPLTPRPSFSSRFPLLSSYKIGYFCSANSVHRRGRVASRPGGGMLKQMMLSEERHRSGPGSNKVMTWHL